MKVKKIQEKEKILNKKKVEKLKEKGITLIALVVTIIILLILAGVTLNMALSGDGLFSRARNAAEKYKKAQEDEQELISDIGKEMNSEYVGAYVTGYTLTEVECKITPKQSGVNKEDEPLNSYNGNIEKDENGNQVFKTETDMKWRIWDYDGTILRIISEKPTEKALYLKGADGYNGGVGAMNKVCNDCYSNGKAGVSARNLRRSDIEKVSTYDYRKFKTKSSYFPVDESSTGDDIINFGENLVLAKDKEIPSAWKKDSEWSYEYNKEKSEMNGNPSCEYPWEYDFTLEETTSSYIEDDENRKIKEAFYSHTYMEGEFEKKEYFDMIFTNGRNSDVQHTYWLGTRFTNKKSTDFTFRSCLCSCY